MLSYCELDYRPLPNFVRPAPAPCPKFGDFIQRSGFVLFQSGAVGGQRQCEVWMREAGQSGARPLAGRGWVPIIRLPA